MRTKRPMCDLHLHLDGSLSVATVRKLAQMQNMEIPEKDEDIIQKLTVSENCRNLNEYLEKFDFPCSLLQTGEAIALAVYNLQEEIKAEGMGYAEIRFAPQKHCEKGMTQDQVVQAAIAGLERSDFCANLILCCMRGEDNDRENYITLEMAAKYKERGVCAVDLAGAEALFPTDNYEDLFVHAKKMGLCFTIHAGEAAGPESVWKALSFGASRIGHGIRSLEDDRLMEFLVKNRIPLELCPSSNLNTGIYASMEEYPIQKFLDAGVLVTINTDNRSVSGTTIARELQKLADAHHLTEAQLDILSANAIEASFASREQKTKFCIE